MTEQLLAACQLAIARWHRRCRAYDAGNASGADLSLAHQDALRALRRAEAAGLDVTDLRNLHKLKEG